MTSATHRTNTQRLYIHTHNTQCSCFTHLPTKSNKYLKLQCTHTHTSTHAYCLSSSSIASSAYYICFDFAFGLDLYLHLGIPWCAAYTLKGECMSMRVFTFVRVCMIRSSRIQAHTDICWIHWRVYSIFSLLFSFFVCIYLVRCFASCSASLGVSVFVWLENLCMRLCIYSTVRLNQMFTIIM